MANPILKDPVGQRISVAKFSGEVGAQQKCTTKWIGIGLTLTNMIAINF